MIVLQNVILNQRINVSSCYQAIRTILVASRINGFGSDYTTKVTCPNCATVSENTFNLDGVEEYLGDDFGDYDIVPTEHGTFIIKN